MNKVTLKHVLRYTTEAAIARYFDISPAAVNQWHLNGIPAARIIGIEILVDRRITRHELNPKLYPAE